MTGGIRVVDCHTHLMSGPEGISDLDRLREKTGAEKINVVSLVDPVDVNENPVVLAAKGEYPDRFYAFCALDHSAYYSSGALEPPTLAEQVDLLGRIGADGIKLLETKPDRRLRLDVRADSDYFGDFFHAVERAGVPLLWHVADPPEFWDPARIPSWAAEQGWGYDESFVQYDQLYEEVEGVLSRHPGLQVIFAHFFFLSDDLPRAAHLFDRYPGVHFDLAPGVEMLYNLSKNPAESREFFGAYSDRILFGTDMWADQTPRQAEARAGLVKRFLETDEEFRVPDHADSLLGPPSDGTIRGMNLPPEVLESVYSANFERIAGAGPAPIDRALACEECKRIAEERLALEGNIKEALVAAVMLDED